MLPALPLSSVNVSFSRLTSVTKPTCEPVAPVGTPLTATATSPTWGIASAVPYLRQFEATAAPEGGTPPAFLMLDAANSPHQSPALGYPISRMNFTSSGSSSAYFAAVANTP